MKNHSAEGIRRLSWLAFVLLLAAPAAADDYQQAIARFSAFAVERIAGDPIPGLSIGFVTDDFQWAAGFGWADLENRVPAGAESAYRLASVTKPLTAIAALKLVEQGKLDLDAEVQTYVPDFPRKPWPITTRQLLGHLGGISHYRDYDLEGHFKDHKTTAESLAVFADFELVAEPGTRYQYSSYGYNLIGAVIEGASGLSYGDYLREHLWGPLGMQATRLDDPDAIIPNRVRGYRRGPDGGLINSEFVNISSRFAAGGLRSTVPDLLKLGRGLIEGKVLEPGTVETMLTPMTTRDGRYTGYAMGWGVRGRNGRLTAAHSGGQAETRTYFLWFPDDGLAIAVACNYEGGDRMPYVERLYREVTGETLLPGVYAGDRVHQTIHAALRTAFEDGLSYARHHGRALSRDPEELNRAFAFFNQNVDPNALARDFDGVRALLANATHPVAGRPSTVVASYIADRLLGSLGEAEVQALHAGGPLPFFAAWIEGYRGRLKAPRAFRFPKRLESLILDWNADWARVWSAATRDLDLEFATEPLAAAKRLHAVARGAAVVPDHWGAMETAIENAAQAGRIEQALELAKLGRELYPESAGPHFHTGLVHLGRGARDEAETWIRRAHATDADAIDAGFLNRWAYTLRGVGLIDPGLALLEIAIELHPAVANLYDSAGEFWLTKGDSERGAALYRKALELDPQFASAKAALDRLENAR